MSGTSTTLYRFRIELSDVDRGVYETLDFRAAQHPSEAVAYLLTRVLAFALNWQEGLEFSPKGLGDPEGPAIFVNELNGRMSMWIEIGNPSPRKLHKAMKAAGAVKVYTYKNPELILNEARGEEIHRASEIEIFALKPDFLDELGRDLPKDARMTVLHNDSVLSVSLNGRQFESEIRLLKLESPS